jgi:hypothetical protein
MSTPAATKIWAAMASETFLGLQTDAIRKIEVKMRSMQKANLNVKKKLHIGVSFHSPKMNRFGKNLWPRARFFWKIFMCTAAPIMKRIMKIDWAGISTCFTGAPPSGHTMGGYGGPWVAYTLSVSDFHAAL